MSKGLKEALNTLVWCFGIACIIPLMAWMFAPRMSANRLYTFFVVSLVYSCFAGMTFHMGSLRVWPYTMSFPPAAALALRGLAFLVFATVASHAATAVLSLWLKTPYWPLFWDGYKTTLIISFTFGAAVASYEGVKHQLATAQLEIKQRELQHERALKMATEAQLASLESRIHPHFLFNALNSISSLIQDDPKRAERLLGEMSALLRFSLDSPQVGLVPLDRELQIVENYLDIEQARFEQRLRYSIERKGDLEGAQVPPLSIQTLVENSIKYAVGPSRAGATIKVTVESSADRLKVDVSDDGPGFELSALRTGHGLDNLSRRLEVLFQDHARIEAHRDATGQMHAGFSIDRAANKSPVTPAVQNSAA